MFSTMILPKMNGTVSGRQTDLIGSMPIADAVTCIAIHAPTARTIVQSQPERRLLHDDGAIVNGHRSKHNIRNMAASAVT